MPKFSEDPNKETHCQKMYELGKQEKSETFFYSLRRRDDYGSSNEPAFFGFSGQDQLKRAKECGRIYNPDGDGKHNWKANLAWLLGLVHADRKIILNTEVIAGVVWRAIRGIFEIVKEAETIKFSAFPREIAAVVKAGYIWEQEADNSFILKRQTEKTAAECEKLELEDITPTDDDVRKTLAEFVLFILAKFIRSEDDCNAIDDYIQYLIDQSENEENKLVQAMYDIFFDLFFIGDGTKTCIEKVKENLLKWLNLMSFFKKENLMYFVDDNFAEMPPKIISWEEVVRKNKKVIEWRNQHSGALQEEESHAPSIC